MKQCDLDLGSRKRKRTRSEMLRASAGFTYVGVVSSVAMLVMAMLLVVFGLHTHLRSLEYVSVQQRLEQTLCDEVVRLRVQSRYTDREEDGILISYSLLEEDWYQGVRIETVKICVEEQTSGAKREQIVALQK